jgi:hypothetical protein
MREESETAINQATILVLALALLFSVVALPLDRPGSTVLVPAAAGATLLGIGLIVTYGRPLDSTPANDTLMFGLVAAPPILVALKLAAMLVGGIV